MTYFGLTDWGVINWAIAIMALYLVGGAMRSALRPVPNERVMRCPNTGSITLVEMERVYPEKGDPAIKIRRCELWPQHGNCNRGCRARYAEASGDFSTRLRALRPF